MIIRLAEKNDLPALSRLAQETYAAEFGGSMTPEELAAEIDKKSIAAFAAAMALGDEFLVAEEGERLAGYIGLRDALGRLEVKGRAPTARDQALNGIYVHPDFQGKGLGRRLMDEAFARPRFRAAKNVYLSVWEENRRACRFYASCGFRPVGRREIITNGRLLGEDLVLMRCTAEKS
jgi:diamine N-acetyltransferase